MADDHKPYYGSDEQPEDLPPEEVIPPTPSPDSVEEIVKSIPQIVQKPDLKGQGIALWKIIVGILSFIAILATIIAAYPVIQPLLPTPLAGEPAIIEGENREVLVLVAQFDAGNDIRLPDVRHNFANIVETAIEDLGDQVTARVLRIPQIITGHDQARAESDRYNATLVIWGEVFPRQLKVNYTISPRWSEIVKEPGETSIAVSSIEELDTVVSTDGGDANFILNFVLGQQLFFEQSYDEALLYFERAIAEAPLERERDLGVDGAYFYKGYIHQVIDQNNEAAIEAYNESLKINPEFAVAYTNRGIARRAQGDVERAIEDYDRALEHDPDSALTYNNRGVANSTNGDLGEALEDYNLAIELNLNFVEAYTNRGLLHFDLNNIEAAILDYEHALKLNPSYVDAYLSRAIARRALGDLEGALADYSRAIEINPHNPLSYYNQGNLRNAQGDLAGAIEDYTRAIEIDPEDISAYNNRGFARYKHGDVEGAIEDYTRAIEIDPEHINAYANRGAARYELGDLEGAIVDYHQARVLNPEYADFYWGLGNAYYALERYEESLANYQRYIELAGDNVDSSVVEFAASLEAQLTATPPG